MKCDLISHQTSSPDLSCRDLPFTTEYNPYTRSFGWRQDPLSFKITSGGTAVQFGACRDNQVAQDTSSLSRGTYTGAATFSFIQALETWGPRQTYAQLLGNMTTTLNRATANGNANASASQGLGGVDSLFGMFLNGSAQAREPQIPVLSCDKPLYLGAQLML
ncbi:hypothetical protein CEUSTIGMA_g2106.t1 [Chlamydomonas eustigma]|uniref:Uncharacterized protein n=1 Tax=Chlamydomonas eustigma TaxID=1157962 RepID=A0A250WV05_9CHLO|nr:hypothetical protein CEUSTIGMA_g2106.t1 [Chlamydomonas eustigma]|eukprot:GAX74658.1 hypothetical protein CEUSTIGMA_g2106.t1 [Chlamydomonas eustigma]